MCTRLKYFNISNASGLIDAVLGLSEPLTQLFVFIEKFLDRISLICQVNTQLLTLLCQARHILAELVAIKTELPELFILVGERIIVSFQLCDLALDSGNQSNVLIQDALEVPRFVSRSVIHHQFEGLHHAKLLIVPAQGQCQLLTFPIVVEELLVLVADMIDHFFILLSAVSEHL